MTGVKTALMRKFGPLPAWAWALIAGAGIYIYRTRKSLGSTGAQVAAQTDAPLAPLSPDASSSPGGGSGGGSDIPGRGEPNPLQGTDPVQLPPDRQLLDPLILAPGERVYDPNSGRVQGDQDGNGNGATHKRTKKPKPHHTPAKSVPKGGHHKTRTRSIAQTITGRKHKGDPHGPPSKPPHGGKGDPHGPPARGKPRNNGGSPVVPVTPRKHAPPAPAPVQRQRPAPQHTSTPAPKPPPAHHPAPVHHPAPPRRRK